MSNNNCCTTDSLLPPNSKYKIYEKIGSGAYGEVYKGTRDDDGLSVALKRVMITDEDGYNNIPLSTHRELNVLRRLNKLGNDNIVRLFDIVLNKIGNRMCIDLVFELSEYDLETYLKLFNIGGDMPISKILNLGQQLMDGVHFMHSYRVLHRDLKPANILIDRHGSDLKITDFGLARILGFDAALTPIAVTLWYRSPEILFKNSYLTACDVWSAGCIIGEMVYGRPLFAAENEVKQMEKIVCRLGYEAIGHWPEDSFIDSSSFLDAIDPSRSLDRILRRADVGLRGLIKALLRFDPDKRLLSTDALSRLKELKEKASLSNGHGCTCRTSLSIPSTLRPLCSLPDCASESQDFLVVSSVVRNVLDDDFNDDRSPSDTIPGLVDCHSIQDYPHEEVEVTESSDISLTSSRTSSPSNSSQESVVNEDDQDMARQKKESPDEIGDSFSSYRSQNNESFSSYAPSSQTGVESTDDDLQDADADLHELQEFNDGFIISDGSSSDTCQAADLSARTVVAEEHTNQSLAVLDRDDDRCDGTSQNSPRSAETAGPYISPFLIAVDQAIGEDKIALTRQRSVPLQEVNRELTPTTVLPWTQKAPPMVTRKRIIDSDDNSDEEGSVQQLENNSPCRVPTLLPVLARHKSLRRRLSVVGPHQSSDRKASLLTRCASVLIPAVIGENDEAETIQNQSFGEHSLARALEDSVGLARHSPLPASTLLSDRPKIIVRRRSQYK